MYCMFFILQQNYMSVCKYFLLLSVVINFPPFFVLEYCSAILFINILIRFFTVTIRWFILATLSLAVKNNYLLRHDFDHLEKYVLSQLYILYNKI